VFGWAWRFQITVGGIQSPRKEQALDFETKSAILEERRKNLKKGLAASCNEPPINYPV